MSVRLDLLVWYRSQCLADVASVEGHHRIPRTPCPPLLPAPNFAPAMPRIVLPFAHLRVLALLFPVCAALVWRCAAEKPPFGGPPDTEGPRVVRVEPLSGTPDLAPDRSIEITFDEMVDPVSVPGSVVFTPEVSFTTRIRGRRIIIRPEEPFQASRAYVLTLQRGIRDYQRNSIARSYQLVFSTGGDIPEGCIRGRVAEYDPQRPVEVGLFAWADTLAAASLGLAPPAGPGGTTDEFVLVQSVDLAADGSFSFAYLPDGTYRLVAVEGGMSDFPAALHRRPYALPPSDPLVIKGDTTTVAMRRSPPLSRPQLQSVEWVTPNYLTITFDTPFGEAPLPANLYSTDDPLIYGYVLPTTGRDTTVIDLGQGYTQLGEPYRLETLAVPTPQLVDTVPPALTVPGGRITLVPSPTGDQGLLAEGGPLGLAGPGARYAQALGRITFSEPVRLSPGPPRGGEPRRNRNGESGGGLRAHLMGRDTLDVLLRQETPLAAVMDIPEPERYSRAAVLGWEITDEAGNTMTDSILSLTLVYTPPQATGSIRGTVVGLSSRVVVEAREADTGRRVAYTVTDSVGLFGGTSQTGYLLGSVPPGFYALFGYEQIGAYPVPYYSGRWVPFHRAARFTYYPELVEVRPRWEVDGIDINFINVTPIFPQDSSTVSRE